MTPPESRHERYHRAIEQAFDAMVIADDEGRYVAVNPSACELFGVSEDDLLGSHIAEFAPDDYDFEEEWAAFETSERDRGTFPLVRPDGERRVVEFAATANIVPGEHLSVLRDVTERVRRERRLEEQRDGLELLNEILRHDIRNDLQVVLGYLDELRGHVADDGQRYLETALESAKNAVDITHTAETLATAMSRTETDSGAVPLADALGSSVEATRGSYPEATVRYEEPGSDVTVCGDDMLVTVFRNLLRNAVQHSDRESPTIDVTVRVGDDVVAVSVADDGPGIAADQQASIFQRAERGDESGEHGLGLYLVQTVVEQYGGTVTVADNEPRGTVFTVELPRAD